MSGVNCQTDSPMDEWGIKGMKNLLQFFENIKSPVTLSVLCKPAIWGKFAFAKYVIRFLSVFLDDKFRRMVVRAGKGQDENNDAAH